MSATKNKQKGGVALEYILVSAFAAVASTLILGVIGGITKQKLEQLKEKFGIEADFSAFDSFDKTP